MDANPHNTLSNYIVNFPHTLTLDETWEVGLSEIHFSLDHDETTRSEESDEITFSKKDVTIRLDSAVNFRNKYSLCDNINTILAHEFSNESPYLWYDESGVFHQDKNVVLSNSLEIKLNKKEPSHLYVYCSIVKAQYVGNVLAPLLRIVNTLKNTINTITYDNPQYLPVAQRHINQIEIDIRDDKGNHIKFLNGRTICVLHARRSYL